MQIRYAIGQEHYQRMTTEELRKHFLLETIFIPGESLLTYWETDRTIIGGILPLVDTITLETEELLASEYFCERREIGVFNLGGPGEVIVDGKGFGLKTLDAIYIGRGSRDVRFLSFNKDNFARFLLISYPAHVSYPTRMVSLDQASRLELGALETANQRSILQFIHERGVPSCQLVAGITQLKVGSVWNTMPPHTHSQRSEIYFYFGLAEDASVFHFMGPKDQTRHLVVRNEQAVFSPIWSIHSGCGTGAYSFVWAMGGENQNFNNMTAIKISELK
jgi:4-deoxy-L-threo-5-hexosulose-uronate ketol-isomerase